MTGKIHLIRHDDYELPGTIPDWAADRGRSVQEIRFFTGEPIPPATDSSPVVLLGGTMSANDEASFPWLRLEKHWVAQAIGAGRRILGICLGAQILASVLGARVSRNQHREIGWFPIRRADSAGDSGFSEAIPNGHQVFHWHSDVFELPAGAVRIAGSQASENQAFAWGGRVVGVQFHPEMTAAGARVLVDHIGDEIVPGPFVQPSELLFDRPERFDAMAPVMAALLDALVGGR